ncbi:MAG: hypothetical protein WAO23_08295, partial [Dethiobacteria bacterium]
IISLSLGQIFIFSFQVPLPCHSERSEESCEKTNILPRYNSGYINIKPATGRGDSVSGDDGGTVVVKILRSHPLPLDDNKKSIRSLWMKTKKASAPSG